MVSTQGSNCLGPREVLHRVVWMKMGRVVKDLEGEERPITMLCVSCLRRARRLLQKLVNELWVQEHIKHDQLREGQVGDTSSVPAIDSIPHEIPAVTSDNVRQTFSSLFERQSPTDYEAISTLKWNQVSVEDTSQTTEARNGTEDQLSIDEVKAAVVQMKNSTRGLDQVTELP